MDVYDEYALFVTDYLKENEQHVGYLASLCAGLEVPFMIILGVLSSRLQTRTLFDLWSDFWWFILLQHWGI